MVVRIQKGSCLCRGVTYEIHGPLRDVLNCHCSMCRKAHGAAFRTRAAVNAADFKFLSGEELLTFYESSRGERRSFCRICGSSILTKFDKFPDVYGFALGTLDTDPGVRIEQHIFTGHKASWFEITDDLPQVEELDNRALDGVKGS